MALNCNVTEVFLREKYRMCNLEGCNKCELANDKQLWCGDFMCRYPKEAVEIVQKWSDANPLETRQSKILKMFPNIQIKKYADIGTVVDIAPCVVDTSYKDELCLLQKTCEQCKKEYWLI